MKIKDLGRDYAQLSKLVAKYGLHVQNYPADFDSVLKFCSSAQKQLHELAHVRRALDTINIYSPLSSVDYNAIFVRLNNEEDQLRDSLNKEF